MKRSKSPWHLINKMRAQNAEFQKSRKLDASRKGSVGKRRVDDSGEPLSGAEVSAVPGSDDERAHVGTGGIV